MPALVRGNGGDGCRLHHRHAYHAFWRRALQFEACGMWEDMAYNAGPLISPRHFKQYLVPHYRRITDLLHKHSVDVVWVDCDGNIEKLMPLWLEAGVNCMFPLEIGTWGADPINYRREYGKDLLIMGGFDKHILADYQGSHRGRGPSPHAARRGRRLHRILRPPRPARRALR